MDATIETSFLVQKAMLDQAKTLARQLNLSQDQLFEMALAAFIKAHQIQTPPGEINQTKLVINQGDIFWVRLDDSHESEPGIPHPQLVVQDNVFNHSRINTVIVCALTSNIKRVNMPGNVLLDAGEADLPRQSVVEVSKLSTVYKTQLGAYIGSLTEQRVNQVLAGMRFVQSSFLADG